MLFASKKILIADDDRDAGAVLAGRLRALGCDVAPVVSSIDEACALAAGELPSAVLVAMALSDATTGGLAEVRARFPMPVVSIAPNPSAGPARGLEPWDYVMRDAEERELRLVLGGLWALDAAEERVRELESRLSEERAYGDLGRVAGQTAHQFNNLLMAVASGVALVRMDTPEGSLTLPHLDNLDTALERGAGVCQQLLAGVRRESGAFAPGGSGPGEIAAVEGGSRSPGGGARIHGAVLIVDDDESVRALARWVVERAGYQAVTARDGDEALEKFRADPGAYGLVLLDLTMPRMSGEEVLVGLRSLRPNVRVVVITGYGEDAVRDSECEGIAGFLQKPFSPDALRAMLQRCEV